MKNNIDNLISEELKKVTLLFKYDTQKTLSENIEEQQVGDKNAQATVSGTTPSTEPTSVLITKNPNDKSYDYMMKDGKYYFKGKPGTQYATKYPDWREAKAPKGIAAIKALFDKNPKGDTPVESTTPANNSEKYKEFFAQKLKDAQNLPKTLPGVQGGETPKQQNDGIIDSDAEANNTQVQGQVQSNVSNDEEF